MSNLTEREDNWYKNAKTLDGRSPETFFLAFEITDKHTAHRRYGLAIERCSTGADRERLKEEFDQWKRSKGTAYWTDQQARLSAMRTAGALIEASEPYAEDSLRRASKMVEAPQGMFYSSISLLFMDEGCNGIETLIEICTIGTCLS